MTSTIINMDRRPNVGVTVSKTEPSTDPSARESVSETDSMVGDKYIVVRKSEYTNALIKASVAADCKADSNKRSQNEPPDGKKLAADPVAMRLESVVLSRPRLHALRRGPAKNGLIRVVLWQKIGQTQATTPLLTASALQPSSADGFTQFAAVYDECRCLGGVFHTYPTVDVAGVGSGVVSFDPAVSGNLATVTGGLEQKYNTGPFCITGHFSGAATVGVANAKGFHTVHFKTVRSFESGTTNDKIGSNWYPTSVTSSIIGYLKPYLENPAAGNLALTTFVGYDMEFKYRG